MLNPFRAFQGELWKKVDLKDWNEKKYLAFFESVDRFTVLKDGTHTLSVTTEGLMSLEQEAFSGQFPFLQELVTRIDRMTTDPKATPHKFYDRFAACIRMVGGYLKEHPSLVTDEMRGIIERNPRLAWCLTRFEIKDTKPGVPLVVEKRLDEVIPSDKRVTSKVRDSNLQLAESRVFLADALLAVTSTLTKRELKQLSTKEKITAALGIMKVLQSAANFKPNIGVMNQLVINKASRDDLESAMLDFNKAKE